MSLRFLMNPEEGPILHPKVSRNVSGMKFPWPLNQCCEDRDAWSKGIATWRRGKYVFITCRSQHEIRRALFRKVGIALTS